LLLLQLLLLLLQMLELLQLPSRLEGSRLLLQFEPCLLHCFVKGNSARPAASTVQQQHAPRRAHHLPAVAKHAQPLLHCWLDEPLRARPLQPPTR
jgi:hypothetical protein